jgi:Radical SAM superfamily
MSAKGHKRTHRLMPAIPFIRSGEKNMSQPVSAQDLLTPYVDVALFAVTTNCNLRCTYCPVISPTYVGEDFDLSQTDDLAEEFTLAKVRLVQISGHGETTIIPGWEKLCEAFERRGIAVCITSNFSNIFSDAEIDALARMTHITISIDTVDRELLARMRRRVDLRTILYNMSRVRLRAKQLDRKPAFNWQCTLSDEVTAGLQNWLDMGILNGVTHFTLGNLLAYPGVPGSSRHVATLDGPALETACRELTNLKQRARAAGVALTIQTGIVEGINEKLWSSGVSQPFQL